MLDVFRLEDPTPFGCRMGLMIWENDVGDLVVVLGHPGSRQESVREWSLFIGEALRRVADDFDKTDTLNDLLAHEFWELLPKAPILCIGDH